eukprot:Hpha_TRINITY_DN12282_c0_g3::TRINITY_DN12282_c0_g3_i1::g.16674::m.16674
MLRCSGVLFAIVGLIASLPLILTVGLPLADAFGPSLIVGFSPLNLRGKSFGFNFDQIPDLTGKVAVVTGANSGLGYWTGLHLARKGARTILTCRSASKCKAAVESIKANHSTAIVEPMQLDLGSLQSVRDFAAALLKKHPRVDTLVMNAGVMALEYALTADGIEQHFGVNHVAHQLLGSLLEPALGEGSTVVVMSSMVAYITRFPGGVPLSLEAANKKEWYDGSDMYSMSKLANIYYAQELAERLKAKGVRVNAVHPGWVWTALFDHVFDSFRTFLGDTVGGAIAGALSKTIQTIGWDAETASLSELYAAVSPAVVGGGITGHYFHPIAQAVRSPASDIAKQKALWEFTEQLIKSKSPA